MQKKPDPYSRTGGKSHSIRRNSKMELMKSMATILFILICLAKLQTLVSLSKNERGTESNVLKGNDSIFFLNEKMI